MLTPQEVAKKSFTKARMGGYTMAMVDEFLDVLTEDYTSLYEENAKLKAKLKVLVEKVEEYRSTEESMRAALFSAQKMASTIVEEAKAKSLDIVTTAETGAKEEIARIRAEVEKEEQRLSFAKSETALFVAKWKAVCDQQAAFLDAVVTMPMEELVAAAAEPQLEETAEEPVAEAKPEPTIEDTINTILREAAAAESEVEEEEEPVFVEEEAVETVEPMTEIPSAEDLAGMFETRRFRLDELQFGRNYDTK